MSHDKNDDVVGSIERSRPSTLDYVATQTLIPGSPFELQVLDTVKRGSETAAHADLEQGRNVSASGTTTAIHSRTDLKLTDQTNLLPFRKIVSVFAGLAVCIVVSTLDMTLVATALSSLSADFHAGMSFRRMVSVRHRS